MEAVMDSSSSSSYLKLVSCSDKSMGFMYLGNDNLVGKSLLRIPFHHSRYKHLKNKELVDSKLSISVSSTRRPVHPVSLSSSHTQAEVGNHELLMEQSKNGYTKARTVCVRFQLQKECSFGQNFLLVGDDSMLGLWDPMNAIPLTWSEGHLWTVDLDIPIEKPIKFKFIMQESDGKFVWQPGPDRMLECFETRNIVTLCEDWENPDSRKIFEANPTLNHVEEPAATANIHTVAASNERIPVDLMDAISSTSIPETQESEGYTINMNKMLVSDQGVPVLVPGLDHLPIMDTDQEQSGHEAPKDEVNRAVMASTGTDMAKDLKLPELDSKPDANTLNLNSRTALSSIHENQDSYKNQCQETQEVDQQATQSTKGLPLNDIRWEDNVMQKLLSIFGIS